MSCKPGIPALKMLFALSPNRCAYQHPESGTRCEQRLADREAARVMGEVAHIAGCRDGSARHDKSMGPAEIDAYDNLVLLCPTYHKEIDDVHPELYSVDYLRDMKRRHEEEAQAPGSPRLSEADAYEFARRVLVEAFGVRPDSTELSDDQTAFAGVAASTANVEGALTVTEGSDVSTASGQSRAVYDEAGGTDEIVDRRITIQDDAGATDSVSQELATEQ